MENNRFLRKLWSPKTKSTQQPIASSDKRPSFNLASFASPVPSSNPITNSGVSPSSLSLEQLQYGGAMNTSRTQSCISSPYRIPKITKVQRNIVKNKTTSGEASSSSISGTLSSTARKILKTLEKMSTPLRDMRKIPPPVVRTPTSLMVRSQRKRTMDNSFCSPQKKRVPPRIGITSSSFANTTTSANAPLDNSLTTKPFIVSPESKSFVDATKSQQTVRKGKPAVLASLSSSEGVKLRPESGNSGGKMKRQRQNMSHYSAVSAPPICEEYVLPPVPNISIQVSSLPSFDLIGPGNTSTPAPTKLFKPNSLKQRVIPQDPSEPLFMFSPPDPHPSPSKRKQVPKSNKSSVQFASKRSVKEINTKTHFKKESHLKPDQTKLTLGQGYESTPKTDNFIDTNKKKTEKTKMPLTRIRAHESAAASEKQSLPLIYQKQTDKWECETCMIMNNNDRSKCEACETPKPDSQSGKSDVKALPLATIFQKSKDKWECEICMIMNNNDRSKCEACETPKPDSQFGKSDVKALPLATIFQKSKDKWECEVCMISNSNNLSKCAACETPKPDACNNKPKPCASKFSNNIGMLKPVSSKTKLSFGISQAQSSKEKPFLSLFGTSKWKCSSCSSENNKDKTQCETCSNPKPVLATDKPNLPLGIVFGSKDNYMKSAATDTKWTCTTCLVTNDCHRIKCVACENPRSASAADKNVPSWEKSSFIFGSTSSNVLKFGTPAKDTNSSIAVPSSADAKIIATPNVIKPFTKGILSTGIQFGVPPTVTSTSSAASTCSSLPSVSSVTTTNSQSCINFFTSKSISPPSLSTTPTLTTILTKKRSFPEANNQSTSAKLPMFGESAGQSATTSSSAPIKFGGGNIQNAANFTTKPDAPKGFGFAFGSKTVEGLTPKLNSAVTTAPADVQVVDQGKFTGFVKKLSTPQSQLTSTATTNLQSSTPQNLFGHIQTALPTKTNVEGKKEPLQFSVFSQKTAVVSQTVTCAQSTFLFGTSTMSHPIADPNVSGQTVAVKPTMMPGNPSAASSQPTHNLFGNASVTNPSLMFGRTSTAVSVPNPAPASGFAFESSTPFQSQSDLLAVTTIGASSGISTFPTVGAIADKAGAPSFPFQGSSSQPVSKVLFGSIAPSTEPPKPSGFNFDNALSAAPSGFNFGQSDANKQSQSMFSASSNASSGFNFAASQNNPAFSSASGTTFQVGAGNANPTPAGSRFQFNAPSALPAPMFGSNPGGGMFNIGQNRSTTPVQSRVIRRAQRRLRK